MTERDILYQFSEGDRVLYMREEGSELLVFVANKDLPLMIYRFDKDLKVVDVEALP